MRPWVFTLVAVAAALLPQPASAAKGLLVGATDDLFQTEPHVARAVAADLGLQAAEVTVRWEPNQTGLTTQQVTMLDNAASTGQRIVLAAYGQWYATPIDAAARETYCSFIANVLGRYPQIHDVVIWNEPNLAFFWRPQWREDGSPAAPADYTALLARCWDVLHAVRPGVNVIAPATSPWGFDDPDHPWRLAHSPTLFIRRMGEAYRASGRDRPIFDTVAHHPYGEFWYERPWKSHTWDKRIGQGDHNRLLEALQDGFAGTPQPVPGKPVGGAAASIWYTETGFETTPDPDKQTVYTNWAAQVPALIPDALGLPPWTELPSADSPAPDHATQLRDALHLAYCQPYVTGYFNFLLRDQGDMGAWQTGVLWADRTPKGSYGAFKQAVHDVQNGAVSCPPFGYPQPPGSSPPPASPAVAAAVDELTLLRSTSPSPTARKRTGAPTAGAKALSVVEIVWLPRRAFPSRHAQWRIRVRVTRGARYRAAINGRFVQGTKGVRQLGVNGRLRAGVFSWIRFPARRLRPGTYRVTLRLAASVPKPKAIKVRSKPFRVLRGRARR